MKPPKNLLEENDKDIQKKTAGRGFGRDDFRQYMARKIELQRNQFGLVLPPDPRENSNYQKSPPKVTETRRKRKRVKFSTRVRIKEFKCENHPRKKVKKNPPHRGLLSILDRLQDKYEKESDGDDSKHGMDSPGRAKKTNRRQSKEFERESHDNTDRIPAGILRRGRIESKTDSSVTVIDKNRIYETSKLEKEAPPIADAEETSRDTPTASDDALVAVEEETSQHSTQSSASRTVKRPDLFFYGVVVLVNGYTNPDAGTIQRMIHQHGGDLEKYETGRVTHIIAEHLSTAKANIYKRQRKPTPVCHPQWIVDSVKAFRLLPYAGYLLDEVKDDSVGGKTMKSFFSKPNELPTLNAPKNTNNADQMNVQLSKKERERTPEQIGVIDVESDTEEEPFEQVSEEQTEKSSTSPEFHEREKTEIGSSVAPQVRIQKPTTTIANRAEQESPTKARNDMMSGKLRTVGTDPNFLESYFSSSRLSFIGSFKQRSKQSPTRKSSSATHYPGSSHRFVFHVDMDCFFASVVLRNFPEYRDKPVAISHAGGSHERSKKSTSECATCNYEARKYGIKKGMFFGKAKELCPNLIVLQYDFQGYEEVSAQVSDILHRYSDLYSGGIEQVSCDEAYMELFVPSNAEAAKSLPYDVAGEIAESIRKDIFSVTQCTASIGAANNKLLAKLATDRVKPDGSFVVRNSKDILEALKLRDLPGIGYRKDRDLQSEGLVTVQSVWELGNSAEIELKRILGNATGTKISRFCSGIDDRPILPAARKSIGAECNYGVRFDGPYGVDYMMSGLAKEVQKRMEQVGVRGSRVTLKLKQRKPGAKPPPKFLGHGSCHNHSKSSEIPLTCDWRILQEVGMTLFGEMKIPIDDVRGMGIIVTKLGGENESSTSGFSNTKVNMKSFFQPSKEAATVPTGKVNSHRQTITDVVLGENVNLVAKVEPGCQEVFDFSESREISECRSEDGPANGSTSCHSTQSSRVEGTLCENDDDIALPPLSQIHMSQVMELPNELREQVIAKIQPPPKKNESTVALGEVGGCDGHHEGTHGMTQTESNKARTSPPREGRNGTDEDSMSYRQVSVKRMMKLAAIKHGVAMVDDGSGKPISLTQLESLPLAVQLQVANNDDMGIGPLSPSRRHARSTRKVASQKRTNHVLDEWREEGRGMEENKVDAEEEVNVIDTDRPSESDVDEVVVVENDEVEFVHGTASSFYTDQILPLRTWMDSNPIPGTEEVNRMGEFLTIVVSEDRINDAVQMLRSIKCRKDIWSSNQIYKEQLLKVVVDKYSQMPLGGLLDTKWLGL